MSIYVRNKEDTESSSPALASILRARDDQNVILVDAIVVSIATRSTAARGALVAKIRGVVAAMAIAAVSVAEIPVDRVQRLSCDEFGLLTQSSVCQRKRVCNTAASID